MSGLTGNPSYRRMVDHLHGLGARATGELLAELAIGLSIPDSVILTMLGRYGALNADTVAAVGGDRWPAAPIHAVAGREVA